MSKLAHGHGGRRAKALPLIILLASLAAAAPSHARTPVFRWEKIHLRYARPSLLFASLGLDHTVRYGHTRGDGKPGPDPNFPAGMTDIVPYDADKTIIVRGTPEACAKFRHTALAADVAPPRWQVEAELLRVRNGVTESVGRETLDSVTPGGAQMLSFSVDGQTRSYQLHLRAETDGSIDVDYQYGMQLPTAPVAPDSSEAPSVSGVFVPAQIWSRPSSGIARPGEARAFEDLAVERDVRTPSLDGSTDAPNGVRVLGDDYRLMLTIVASEGAPPSSSVPTPIPER